MAPESALSVESSFFKPPGCEFIISLASTTKPEPLDALDDFAAALAAWSSQSVAAASPALAGGNATLAESDASVVEGARVLLALELSRSLLTLSSRSLHVCCG